MDQFNFNKLFFESKGAPIEYNGKSIIGIDRIPAKFNERFLVTIEETNSKYIQGVGLSGNVKVFDETFKKGVIFEFSSLSPEQRETKRSILPYSFELICKSKKGFIVTYNVALVEGRQEWSTYASGMIKEEIPNGWRYFCNDFQPNDDFNDIIYKVERLS